MKHFIIWKRFNLLVGAYCIRPSIGGVVSFHHLKYLSIGLLPSSVMTKYINKAIGSKNTNIPIMNHIISSFLLLMTGVAHEVATSDNSGLLTKE
jgi:hypothetical protein